jgi:ubiquitin C-terminal hydrolase
MNPLFEDVIANDSKDLVNFIIMTLHEELNKAPRQSLSAILNQTIDQTNPMVVLNNFVKSFVNENQLIISDLFYAMSCTGTQCSGCNIIKYNYQTYFFLIFPLEEVRKYKIEKLQNQFIMTNQNFMNVNPMLYQQNLFNYQLNLQNINSKNNLSSSFKLLIENLWPNNYIQNKNKYFAPEEFKKKISDMNPLFRGIAANDSKDLVNFIIMTLHSELNKNSNKNPNNNYEILDQSKKNLVFNNFCKEFAENNNSIISDLFYSTNCNETKCSNCKIQIDNYQIYFFIIFPLEEVRKYKMQLNQLNNYNNVVNIYDCFDYDRKVNLMTGENSMYCNKCKKTCDFYMSTKLITGPKILIIILNRGKGIEFNVKINFFEILNLSNYIEFNNIDNTGCNYKLIGVITHIGESGMGGHFIAYCRDPISDGWHKYNDAIVTDVINFQTEVIDFAMPYLLFYQKI